MGCLFWFSDLLIDNVIREGVEIRLALHCASLRLFLIMRNVAHTSVCLDQAAFFAIGRVCRGDTPLFVLVEAARVCLDSLHDCND